MQNVLLAVDGSKFSEEAAWVLAHLPHPEPWRLTIVTVVTKPVMRGGYRVADVIDEAFLRDQENAQATFRKIASMFDGANVTVNHVMRDGVAGDTIVQVAEENESDLVVLGARGRTTIARILLGSVSDYVATHAPCSVLVVRPTGLREGNRALRIVIGFEESEASLAAIDEFEDIDWGPATHVDLVAVAPYLVTSFSEAIQSREGIGHLKSVLDDAATTLRDKVDHLKRHIIESDHIGNALVDFAEQHKSDLITVGESDRSTLNRVLLGSVSRFVLRHA